MFGHYCLTTLIDGKEVEIVCDEPTARILLPIWQKGEPNLTGCTDLRTGQYIACFLDGDEPPHVRELSLDSYT